MTCVWMDVQLTGRIPGLGHEETATGERSDEHALGAIREAVVVVEEAVQPGGLHIQAVQLTVDLHLAWVGHERPNHHAVVEITEGGISHLRTLSF